MKKLTFYAFAACMAMAVPAIAADYSLDFAAGAAVRAGASPVMREATCECAATDALSAIAQGDTLTLKFFGDTERTLCVGGEMPGFGGARTFPAHLGDGVFSSLVILRNDGSAFFEVRDIAAARLYRASIDNGIANVEEVDLTNIRRGGCIEVEAPEPSVEEAETAQTPARKLLGAVPGNPYDDNIVAPNGAPVMIDIMLVFDNGACAWVENSSKYSHSITNFAMTQVAKMNTVLANTGLHTNFWYRLVDVMTVDTTYTVVDDQILGIVKKGAESGEGAYGPIKARRAACGADLVSLMIDTDTYWGTTGIGYITHGTNYNTWLGYRQWCYSCCAIRSVDLEYTLSHEVGHNMGLAHSPTLASWTKPGTFDYSNGYNFWGKDDGNPYHTIMAYDQDVNYSGYIEIPYFSSPDYTYQGTVIGTVESNDCTRALRETCAAFAAWHDTAIPLPSDVTFSPAGSEAYRITLSTLGNYEIRYTTDGSEPTRESTLYTESLTLKSGSVTIKAVAVVDENTLGAVAEKTYSAAVELSEYVILKELYGYGWSDEFWDDQDGNAKYPNYWNTSSNKTAVVDVSGILAVNRDIDLGTLVACGTNSLEIVATGNTLSATNLHVMGNTTLIGDKFSFDNWNLHPESTLTLSPGEGQSVTLNKYLALGAEGSTIAITNGTFSVTKGANSGDRISTLQNASVRIDEGGVLSLTPGWVLGYANTNPVTVNGGGVLKIGALESTSRPFVLDGGEIEISASGRAFELRRTSITATEDSAILDKTEKGNAQIYLIEGDTTFTVSSGKTLTVDAKTASTSGIVKRGDGEAKFLREFSHSGTNTINTGTFTIGYTSTTTNCTKWIVAKDATLKVANGCSLIVPQIELSSGAVLELPAAAVAPLAVSNSVALANVAVRLTGVTDFGLGKSYPLIAAQDGFTGIVKIDKSRMPAPGEGLAWKFAKDADGVLCAVVVDEADAKEPITIVGVDDSLALEIPDDATSTYGAVAVGTNPLVVDSIGDTAVAFTLDVEIPETQSETEQTICSWIVADNNVVRCVRRADGVLDVFYAASSHADNITNSVALTSGRHTIKIGYNYGEYGGTWVFVDDAPAYWAQNLKWAVKTVLKLTVGATADATPQYPFSGLVLRGLGILRANSKLPLPNMTGTSGITYNYLIQNNSPTNNIPSVFPNAIAGGFSMDNSLLDASLPNSADSITVSIVASFPADKTGCLFGIWAKPSAEQYSYPGQVDYNGNGIFTFSRNGYIKDFYYTFENDPDTSVESPHLYTLTYTRNFGFEFYQDGVLILTADYGYQDADMYVFNKVTFGRGPWNKMTTNYEDNPNPMSGFKVYASHIELGTDDRSVSEAAVMESLNFDASFDGMTIAEKLAYLPEHQTASGVSKPVFVDVLVGYDQGAQAYVANKGVTLEKFAETQIGKMNDVLATNRLDRYYTYRLVGVCKVDGTYDNIDAAPGLAAAGAGETVSLRAARELCGADTVTFLVDTTGNTLGNSSPLSSVNDVADQHECAFSACSIRAVDTGKQHTMIHENAHNMGCGHARAQGANICSPFEYGRGFYFKDGNITRHTIMAYGGDNDASWYFSTSSSEFGFVLGDADNDNARVLRETCGAVAQWRDGGAIDFGGVSLDGVAWRTSRRFAWIAEGDTIRSFNQTDYKYQCTTPLKATIAGPKRLSFMHKSYFGGIAVAGDNYSHFDILLDDSPILSQTECTNYWSDAYVDIPEGTHEVTFVFSQRYAMNNPADYKDGKAEADDAVWLKDISLGDIPPSGVVLEIAAGESVALTDVAADVTAITGEGTLVCDGVLPDAKYGFVNAAWKGTVALKNLAISDATKNVKFEEYGNAASKISLEKCALNWLNASNTTTTDRAFAGTLVLIGDGAFSTKDGYSSNYNIFGALEGSGSMRFDTKPMQAYVFNTATNFTGGIYVGAETNQNQQAMQGRRIVFGSVASSSDLPGQSASITIKSGADAAIGGGATWYAYNGIDISGTLIVKGAGATLDCNAGGTVGLKLNDGATIRFDAADASLSFSQKAAFASGTATIEFAPGVVPQAKRQTLITWNEKPGGNFSLSGLAGWYLEVGEGGLDVVKSKPSDEDRLDIGDGGAYIALDSALEEWMDEKGLEWQRAEYPSLTWQEFMAGDDYKAANGYLLWQCYLLGLDNTGRTDDTLKANIELRDGKVVVTTAENARAVEGVKLWTTLYGSNTLVKPLPFLMKVEGTSIEMPQDSSGFYSVGVSFEAE